MYAKAINFVSGRDNLKISPESDIISLTQVIYFEGASIIVNFPSSIAISKTSLDSKSLISAVISGTVKLLFEIILKPLMNADASNT